MTFQVDVRINRREYINRSVDISVNFDPKNYTKTLDALIDSCKELQPDLTDKEAIDYLTGCLHIQLDRNLQGLRTGAERKQAEEM